MSTQSANLQPHENSFGEFAQFSETLRQLRLSDNNDLNGWYDLPTWVHIV